MKISFFFKTFLLLFILPVSLFCQMNSQQYTNNMGNAIIIGPYIEYSRLDNSDATNFGINAGLYSNKNEIGFSLQKLFPRVKCNLNNNYDLEFAIFSGSLYYIRYFNIDRYLNILIGINFGSSFIKIKYKNILNYYCSSDNQDFTFESDSYLFYKPYLGINYIINRNMLIYLNSGYQINAGLNLNRMDDPEKMYFSGKDINSIFINLSFKYLIVF
jgi:hypothetical protein